MIAVDTNVLVYAHREDSPHHGAALRVLESLAAARQQWAIPWPCLHEMLAVITHPRIYDPPTPPAEALAVMRALTELPNLMLLREAREHTTLLAGLVGPSVVGPKIHDATIAAICLGHGVSELWSGDRDFAWFPDLRVRNPLVGMAGS